jgi:hypothetical protein
MKKPPKLSETEKQLAIILKAEAQQPRVRAGAPEALDHDRDDHPRKGMTEMEDALYGMIESYDILLAAVPNPSVVRGVIMGAFIISAEKARDVLLKALSNRPA